METERKYILLVMCDTKCMRRGKAHNGSRSVRKKHHRSLSKKERTIQIVVRISLFIIIIIIMVIGIAGLISNRGKYASQAGKNDNGKYYQEDREVSISKLFEKADEVLPEFYWYEEIKDSSSEQKLNFYNDKIDSQINRCDVRISRTLDSLSEEDRAEWNKLSLRIGDEEEKKENNSNVADNVILTSVEYWENSALRFEAYCILPESAMAQQYARNAGDALTILIGKEGSNREENRSSALKYGQRAYEGYICLFGYLDTEGTKADICYWLTDIFVQYLVHAEFLTSSEREHCTWMAYVYSNKGLLLAKSEANVQHRKDLEEDNSLVKEILINEFGYVGLIE